MVIVACLIGRVLPVKGLLVPWIELVTFQVSMRFWIVTGKDLKPVLERFVRLMVLVRPVDLEGPMFQHQFGLNVNLFERHR
jgi:hypothetical protein